MKQKYILSAISICLSVILSILLIIGIVKIDLLDMKMLILVILFFLIIIITTLFTYFSKKQSIYNIGVFINFLFNIVLIYNISDLNAKYDYIRDIFSNDYKYVTYNVYVQRKTVTYDNIVKLDGKKIGTLNGSFLDVKSNFSKDIDVLFIPYNDIIEIENAILNGEIQSFVLTEDELLDVNDVKNDIMKRVRVIYTDKYRDFV